MTIFLSFLVGFLIFFFLIFFLGFFFFFNLILFLRSGDKQVSTVGHTT